MRSVSVARLAVALLLLTACSGDDVADDEIGETGEPDPDPVDPFDGGGAVPPGDPSLEARWVAPSTLGNGLVHDTRFKVDPSSHASAAAVADLANGVPWSSFVDSNVAMLARGFRPAQVDAVIGLARDLEITDDTLYISDDDANYRTEIFTHVFSTLASEQDFEDWDPIALGARPTSIQTFALGSQLGYSVAWVYDSATTTPTVPWVMKVGQSKEQLEVLLANPDLRPISLSSRRRQGNSEYAVILVESDSAENWSASIDVPASGLVDEIAEHWQDGFYPFRITAENGNQTRVNVLWAMRAPGISVQARVDLTDSTFEDEDGWWRSHGYHLETVDEYVNGGEVRRAAVWVRYQPYLRWEGTEFAPGDANYTNKYKMFHDQAVRIIGNLTEADCSGGQLCPAGTSCFSCSAAVPCFNDDVCVEEDFGQFTRPSATLHIFEGSRLVLNRAYTFAPSIYTNTPLNASFRTGSVAKSLTATAVVREMDVQGLSLDASFAEVIGVSSVYSLQAALGPIPQALTVRVQDVLDNQGGFPGDSESPNSYYSHTIIVAAGATAPVGGAELFEYVFAPPPDGHVNIGLLDGDSYWQPEWFVQSRTTGTMRYSNAGYSLAGEIVRVQSGIPYEEYVVINLLGPVDLAERIFPDSGGRVHARGPSLASVGDYLVDSRHPYNVDSPDPEQPAVGLEANPVEDWDPYLGPGDPRAPARAAGRYGGRYYLGGAPLAAGGWSADGDALGRLIRTISRSNALLPLTAAAWMWHPALWNFNHGQATGWAYVHGWYVRGNWVGWMGSAEGAVALTIHNRMYDVTVVFLANGLGSPANFINPLMESPDLVQGSSRIGQVWPCIPDPSFAPLTGCELPVAAVY